MLTQQRVIWDDNGTLKDISFAVQDFYRNSQVLPLVAADDKLYIGSRWPFNHRWFEVSVANDVASAVTVEIWNGSEWIAAVDVEDQTQATADKTLSGSGIIKWTVPRTASFGREDTTENIAALSSLKIYGLYWVRLTFSVSLKATTALSYLGFKFASDEDLSAHGYPDLNTSDAKTAYSSGKTDWKEQHFAAAEEIISWLMKKGYVIDGNQVVDWGQFNIPAVHKCAEIIMRSWGPEWEQRRTEAIKAFYSNLDMGNFRVDRNLSGKPEVSETYTQMGIYRR